MRSRLRCGERAPRPRARRSPNRPKNRQRAGKTCTPARRYAFACRYSGSEAAHFENGDLRHERRSARAFFAGPSAVRIVSPRRQQSLSCTCSWRSDALGDEFVQFGHLAGAKRGEVVAPALPEGFCSSPTSCSILRVTSGTSSRILARSGARRSGPAPRAGIADRLATAHLARCRTRDVRWPRGSV
jgi:hypothetical protein